MSFNSNCVVVVLKYHVILACAAVIMSCDMEFD